MTVNTEMPVFETTDSRSTAGAADTQELLHTMAAVVRTVFGVALQAPAEAPVEDAAPAAEPAQLSPVSLSLPPETQLPVSVPVAAPVAAPEVPQVPTSIAVDFLPTVEVLELEQTIGLAAVPDAAPAPPAPMTSISLDDSSWAPAPPPPAPAAVPAVPAYSPAEPAASLPMPDGYPASIAVPAYVAPVLPEPATIDRHSMALLQEIAFLDD